MLNNSVRILDFDGSITDFAALPMTPISLEKSPIVFFDFDNTVTMRDVLDDMLERFSMDQAWKVLEEQWEKGQISTLECLAGQVGVLRITKKDLDMYLSTVDLDTYFKKLLSWLDSLHVKAVILSDNFDYIVKRILENHGIKNLPVFANRLEFDQNRLIPRFPFQSSECKACAHCKRNTLLHNMNGDSVSIYVGDGLSDVCPARCADVVFAKDALLSYLKKHDIPHIPFNTLKDVQLHLKSSFATAPPAQEAVANPR